MLGLLKAITHAQGHMLSKFGLLLYIGKKDYEYDKKFCPTKLLWIAMWEKMSVKMFALLYKYLSNKQTFAFVNLPLMKILQFSLF